MGTRMSQFLADASWDPGGVSPREMSALAKGAEQVNPDDRGAYLGSAQALVNAAGRDAMSVHDQAVPGDPPGPGGADGENYRKVFAVIDSDQSAAQRFNAQALAGAQFLEEQYAQAAAHGENRSSDLRTVGAFERGRLVSEAVRGVDHVEQARGAADEPTLAPGSGAGRQERANRRHPRHQPLNARGGHARGLVASSR